VADKNKNLVKQEAGQTGRLLAPVTPSVKRAFLQGRLQLEVCLFFPCRIKFRDDGVCTTYTGLVILCVMQNQVCFRYKRFRCRTCSVPWHYYDSHPNHENH